MGCGKCVATGKNVTLPSGMPPHLAVYAHFSHSLNSCASATFDAAVLARHVVQMYRQLSLDAVEVRGVGIAVTRLEPAVKERTLDEFARKARPAGASSTSAPPATSTPAAVPAPAAAAPPRAPPVVIVASSVPSVALPPLSQVDPVSAARWAWRVTRAARRR
jgi:hypothetical protein